MIQIKAFPADSPTGRLDEAILEANEWLSLQDEQRGRDIEYLDLKLVQFGDTATVYYRAILVYQERQRGIRLAGGLR